MSLFMSYEQLRAACPSDRWLVKGLIPADATGILFGESGAYKSFVALDLALHLAHGLPWCGRRTQQGAALYIAGEGGSGIRYRLEGWHKQYQLAPSAAPFRVCTIPLPLNRTKIVEDVQKDIEQLAAEIGNPRLVVVDTLSQNYDGDENDSGEMAKLFRNLATYIRATYPGCTVLIIHHPGHSNQGRVRGSYTIIANTDFVYCVAGGNLIASLTCDKMKDADKPDPLTFTLHKIDLGVDEDNEAISSLAATFSQAHSKQGEEHSSLGHDKSKVRRHSVHDARLITVLRGLTTPVTEPELREAFNRACGDKMNAEAKRKAFKRALDATVANGTIIRQSDSLLCLPGTCNDESDL